MIEIEFLPPDVQDFQTLLRREWLETNGVGGWASSSLSGANTRRYHGLLVAKVRAPLERMVLLSKLDETIIVNDVRYELGCNQYPGLVHPQGFRFLTLARRGVFPIFEYQLAAGGIHLRKTIAAINGENTTVVLYERLDDGAPVELRLSPFIAGRDYHHLVKANADVQQHAEFADGILTMEPYRGVPSFSIKVSDAQFEPEPIWYYNFEYSVEFERGLDYREDLFSYGTFTTTLAGGSTVGVVISTEDTANRDPQQLFSKEQQRRQRLQLELQAKCDFTDERDIFLSLATAGDQFIVSRGTGKTVIAGYHWFTDWGRDTMISLPGLSLIHGRYAEAKEVLKTFANAVSQGMIPNRVPEVGETIDYNSVDATLWYFVAVYRYILYSGDMQFADEILGLLLEMVSWHEQGTRYNIHIDEDGLLSAGTAGQQLTWMDAKVGDWVVTPRHGQAVEVNALWYNALAITEQLLTKTGQANEARAFASRCRKLRESFIQNFWNEDLGCLYDYVHGDYQDRAVRPNQLFALSLPFVLVDQERARKILKIVRERLLIPYGLRTLDRSHSEYKGTLRGDPKQRDSAYHQGTAWPWLMGPYMTALCRFEADGASQAAELLPPFADHLRDAGLGTISEIFDGDPPHEPRGCIAQAWSVAEIARAIWEDIWGKAPAGLTHFAD